MVTLVHPDSSRLGVDLAAEGLEIGDVGFVEVGDMGITTELRDRLAPGDLLDDSDTGLLSIGPNLAKSTWAKAATRSREPGGLCRPAAAPPPCIAALMWAMTSSAGDASVAAAGRDAGQVDPVLTCIVAHRGAGVRALAGSGRRRTFGPAQPLARPLWARTA